VSGTFLDRTGWSATTDASSSSADAPDNALDGNYNTRFSTNEDQVSVGHPVDLGAARAFDELAMRAPNSPTDYARGYDVLVSTNDISWTIVAACTGTANPEIVISHQTAQWVRVVLTAASTNRLVVDRRVRPLQQRPADHDNDNNDHHTTTTTVPTTTTRPKLYRRWRRSAQGLPCPPTRSNLDCSAAGDCRARSGSMKAAPCSPPELRNVRGHGVQLGAYLDSKASCWLVNSRYHTVNATEVVTVTNGTTVRKQINPGRRR